MVIAARIGLAGRPRRHRTDSDNLDDDFLDAHAALFVAAMRAGMKLSDVCFGSRSGEAVSPAAT